eukprot:CAMPEP_0184404044 /NCGR_PEP_ID=MMETSP0007-20130409/85734_1 /TAXON_ID=97485 /ORGANISM="Prymnesium parvum, Strain Texoma1" /LENGTH=87 /DNA_ID=CAMNT_0026760181 /DNA_START=513 /DNA_END=774 /DNA_ORIENTATION=-
MMKLLPLAVEVDQPSTPCRHCAVHDGALISYCFASPRASSAGLRILLAEDSYSDGHDVADDDAVVLSSDGADGGAMESGCALRSPAR